MGNILMSLVPTTSTPLWTLTNRPLSNTEDRPTTDDHTNDLIFYRTVLNISSKIMTEKKPWGFIYGAAYEILVNHERLRGTRIYEDHARDGSPHR